MKAPVHHEQQRYMLQALLHKGSMTPEQLAELCKNAFGWSAAVIRRTQKSLLEQGLLQERDGLLTTTITKEDLENSLWDSRLRDSFEWAPPEQPKTATKEPFFKSIWFWSTCAACVVIAVLCALLVFPPSPKTTIPEELQICKEALEKWQENENYCMVYRTEILSHQYMKDLPTIVFTYYVYEDDWMILCYDANNIASTNYPSSLYLDGQLYTTPSTVNKNWQEYQTQTPPYPAPWPMTFDWDNCELTYWGTTTGEETTVYFRVLDHSAEVMGVNEMAFTFDSLGNLMYITTAWIQSDMTVRMDYYGLVDKEPEEISEAITSQLREKSDIGINEPFPEEG